MSDWQPIETAPTDGTRVLAWCKERGARETYVTQYPFRSEGFKAGKRSTNQWRWEEPVAGVCFRWRPTHWMPLPTPPETNQKEGNE